MADLKLRVLEELDERHLPAALARGVLASALHDYLDEARPRHGDDWFTLARQVDRVSADRFDDYVAALTAGGPLVPLASAGATDQRTSLMLRRVMPLPCSLRRLCLPAAVRSQTPEPEPLAISSPAEGSYITGPVLLQVRAKTPGTVRTVTFFADGRSVCTVARPPFECNWDAGPGLREHVVRAVATLADGGKLVATVAHAQRRLRRGRRGRGRAGDGDRHRRRGTLRQGAGPRPVPGEGRRRAAAPHRVCRREHPARDRRGRRRQPQHDRRDADVEGRRAHLPHRAAAGRPGDACWRSTTTSSRWPAGRPTRPCACAPSTGWRPGAARRCYDAMLIALNTVGKQPGRRSLVVFSDGEDQNSVATLKRVETRLETSDATIYTIGLGRSVKDRDLAQVMARMSQMSGGRSFLLDDIKRARDGLRRHRRGALEPVPAVVRLVQRRARRHLAQDPGRAARAEAPGPPSAGLPGGRRKKKKP